MNRMGLLRFGGAVLLILLVAAFAMTLVSGEIAAWPLVVAAAVIAVLARAIGYPPS
jgi:hypothetical protein